MKLIQPTPSQLHAGLRSLITIIDSGKGRSHAQEEVLEVLQRFWGSEVSLAELSPISPEELAAAISPPELRAQLLNAMLIMTLIDGEARPAEVSQVKAFASALGTDPPALKQLEMIAKDHLTLALLDVTRRSGNTKKLLDQLKADKGLRGIRRAALELQGKYEDPALARRYRALEAYPAGTLGRAYWAFCHDNDLSFPGEKGSLPETMASHDCAHVIGGYNTSLQDEVLVLGFTTGKLEGEQVSNAIMFGMLQFQLGVAVASVAPGQTGLFDVSGFLRAVQRGSEMCVNIHDGTWDMWAAFKEPLTELRTRYNVVPRTDH